MQQEYFCRDSTRGRRLCDCQLGPVTYFCAVLGRQVGIGAVVRRVHQPLEGRTDLRSTTKLATGRIPESQLHDTEIACRQGIRRPVHHMGGCGIALTSHHIIISLIGAGCTVKSERTEHGQ